MALFGPPNIEKLKSTHNIKGLLKALDYQKDSKVRTGAAYALGEIGDIRAVEKLNDALSDKDTSVRFSVARALVEIDPKNAGIAAVPFLINVIEKGYSWERPLAAESLGKTGDRRAIKSLIVSLNKCADDDKDTHRITEVLKEIDPNWKKSKEAKEAMLSLIDILKDKDYDVRSNVKKALVMIGESAVEPLFSALLDKDDNVCKGAEETLNEINSNWKKSKEANAAIPNLISALKDESLSNQAAKALYIIDPNWETSEAARTALQMFIDSLKNNNWEVRWRAVIVLGQIGDLNAIPPLITTLGDSDIGLRSKSVEALDKINPNWKNSKIVKTAIPNFITALHDTNKLVRQGAAGALYHIGDASAVEPLIAVLKDEDKDVRWTAANTLGKIKDKRAVEPLIKLLEDNDQYVRFYVVGALRKIGDKRAIRFLVNALNYHYEGVRREAAAALGEIGDASVIDPLIALLEDRDKSVRKEAENALLKLDREKASEIIKNFKKEFNIGMKLEEVINILGQPSSIMAGGSPMTMFGDAVKINNSPSSTKKQKDYVLWDRPEGKYQLVFEGNILVQIYNKPE